MTSLELAHQLEQVFDVAAIHNQIVRGQHVLLQVREVFASQCVGFLLVPRWQIRRYDFSATLMRESAVNHGGLYQRCLKN
jgi:hypothetical protein